MTMRCVYALSITHYMNTIPFLFHLSPVLIKCPMPVPNARRSKYLGPRSQDSTLALQELLTIERLLRKREIVWWAAIIPPK